MELCPHCGKSLIIPHAATVRVLHPNNMGPVLVATGCCGKPVSLYQVKSIKVVKSLANCSFDDYGTPFNKAEEISDECL